MKLISVVTPCYNEEDNVEEIYIQVKNIFENLKQYDYEHIFIDNASKDRTVAILKEIAKNDKHVKIIVNARNFGHIRSSYYVLFQTKGDAVISIVSDLEEPPFLIPEFIKKWEEGYKIVIGVKKTRQEPLIIRTIKKYYYNFLARLSEIEIIPNFSGFGLYDRQIIEILKMMEEPYPYFRGLISEIGFDKVKIEYTHLKRRRGVTKNNFYALYDYAMLGIVNHSKIPLRIATMLGFTLSIISILVALGYFIYKIIFWERFSAGVAPLIIGLFFLCSIQLFFLGILGEYTLSIQTHVLKRPLVIEKERINFD